MTTISVEIDGKKVDVAPGTSIIEAAEKAGVWIPRFCYHKKLSVAANCRMCLVEVEKIGKMQAACASPAGDGMVVHTTSAKALAAQKSVMEFLLINHPLDCPICDQGGECELQDIAMGYGSGISQFSEGKRVVEDEDLGPLIATEMTRCIHCTRCVRFGEEIAGVRELGGTGRGESTRIGTYVKHTVTHEMSGNVIDLCPVGALTAKPSRFEARAWELRQHQTIAAHDCIGSNIYAHTRNDRVMRIIPRENDSINETWISDRDRFSCQALNGNGRLEQPMIKRNGQWHSVDWDVAMQFASEGIKQLIEAAGPEQLAALVSPSASTEEMFLLQQIMRGIGSNNIDHRLRQTDFSDQAHAPFYPKLGLSLSDLQSQDSILLIGSQIRKEQPIAAHRIRKAVLGGAKVSVVNFVSDKFNFDISNQIIVRADQCVNNLIGIAAAVGQIKNEKLPATLLRVESEDIHKAIAEELLAEKSTIIIGALALNHPRAASIRALADWIAEHTGATVGVLTEGANAAGAWMVGAVPHRSLMSNQHVDISAAGEKHSKNISQEKSGPSGGKGASHDANVGLVSVNNPGDSGVKLWENPKQGYILYNVEPGYDCAEPDQAIAAMGEANFVLAFSSYQSQQLSDCADVILPIAPHTESSGSFVNAQGTWQRYRAVAKALGQTRPGWQVLRVLGNLLDLSSFDYESSDDVYQTIKNLLSDKKLDIKPFGLDRVAVKQPKSKIYAIGTVSMYSGDMTLRRAKALQDMPESASRAVMNSELASKYKLNTGDKVVIRQHDSDCILPVVIDDAMIESTVNITIATDETVNFGQNFEAIELVKYEE